MKPYVLITGSTGYVGSYLTEYLAKTRSYNLTLLFEDLTSSGFTIPDADVVVHLAAKPNSFEGDPALLMKTNFQGTVNLAQKCSERTHFIFLSSEQVFKSDSDKVYEENDLTSPETVYGRSKVLAEEFLISHYKRRTILRASLIYGYDHPRRRNSLKFIDEKLSRDEVVEVFTDVYTCPIYISDLCAIIRKVIEQQLLGIYHTCGREYVSRYEIAYLIAKVRGYDTKLLKATEKPEELKIPRFLHLQFSQLFDAEIKTRLEEGIRSSYES